MRKILLFFAFFSLTFADANVTSLSASSVLSEIQKQILAIDEGLKNNVWIMRYANYQTYKKIEEQLEASENALKKVDRNTRKASELNKQIQTLKEQLNLLKEYEKAPFVSMLSAPEIETPPRVTNPVALVGAFSYIKKVGSDLAEYAKHISDLETLVARLEYKISLLNRSYEILPDEQVQGEIYELRQEISELNGAKQIAQTTLGVINKRVDGAINVTKSEIKSQFFSMITIALIIIAVIAVSFFFKFIAKRTISDEERVYTVNKFINFIDVTLIILILLFAYIENVTYIVTVLGFASAGIAIAMKDMFMSILGWVVVIFGGSFHVGDRVKVVRNGVTHVGDIIDISLLRMTIMEDVTLASYLDGGHRAGRIVFVPNNYIFTELISNYSHYGMKTVWDGIDVCISFDSNHKKAVAIAKDVVLKCGAKYTEVAKRQMNRLRTQYSIKNPNVEPRIFTLFEPYGINISIWYMASSTATLALRSKISAELIDAFKNESDIRIAYPTQTIYTARKMPVLPNVEQELESTDE